MKVMNFITLNCEPTLFVREFYIILYAFVDGCGIQFLG